MKVILFSLLVVIMVGSCYFADKQSEKRTAHQKTAQAALLETPAEAPQETVVWNPFQRKRPHLKSLSSL